jgi:C4-dicarboxylate transporter DctM subunit
MFEPSQMIVLITVLLGAVFLGVHIAVALGVTAVLGLFMMTGDINNTATFISNSAYEVLRDYVFAVLPLFLLMGEFLAKCGAATDLFALVNRGSRWLVGRVAIATVLANAVFAFITGSSIASAAAFSRIAWPEMQRFGYDRKFGLGCIAGSACLGMLIPPSVLMIVWGVITEESIGTLFIAGVIPGFAVTALFCMYIIAVAIIRPQRVGEGPAPQAVGAAPVAAAGSQQDEDDIDMTRTAIGTALVLALVFGVLGGIWGGVFTPTEGAGVGAALSLVMALSRGTTLREIFEVILSVGRTSAPLLLLLIFAQLYSRVLSMTGVTGLVESLFVGSGLEPWQILACMVLLWFALGCVIDSISIILLTVPVFQPIAVAIGFDPTAFAILGILAIETGLLTPPFGLLVFTVKAALPEENISAGEIFAGAIPYWICLLMVIVSIAAVPEIATWLPNIGR